MTTTDEIREAKERAGEDAYLWAQRDAGDVILYESEAASLDGSSGLQRWTVAAEVIDDLCDAGLVDGRN